MTRYQNNTKTMILCSFFTALIAIGAFIRIPLPVTVFSLQFTFVLLSGMILGSKAGALSSLLYVVIGLLGFPIFTEGGGLGYVLKPTFGYLIAFIAASYIAGLTREKFGTKSVNKLIVGCILAMIVTYAIGTLYTYFILNKVANTPIPYWACLSSLFPFAIAKDIFSAIIVSLATPRLLKITKNHS